MKLGHAWDPDEDRGPVVVPPVTGPAGETAPLGDLSTALCTQNTRHMRHRVCGGNGAFPQPEPELPSAQGSHLRALLPAGGLPATATPAARLFTR